MVYATHWNPTGMPPFPLLNLFLTVMTVIFNDVHSKVNIREQLGHNRVLGALFDEVLYADDTIIFSEDAKALESLLCEVEKEGERYGMKLNKKKCEALCVRGNDEIRFKCGSIVPPHDESKYLGCMLNVKGDPKRELNKRITDSFVTWKN